MMKRLVYGIGIFALMVIAALGTAIGTRGDEPAWIQYSEPLAGENSPTYTDVINRPAKTIWSNFLVEHEENGYHNYSALASHLNIDVDTSDKLDVTTFTTEHNVDGSHSTPIPSSTTTLSEGNNLYYTDTRVNANSSVMANTNHRSNTSNPHNVTAVQTGAVAQSLWTVEHKLDGTHNVIMPTGSEYALQGDGNGNIAERTIAPTGWIDNNGFDFWGCFVFSRLNIAESLYHVIETEYSQNIVNIWKTADNRLALSIGGSTVSTTYFEFTSSHLHRPIEIAISFDGSNIVFMIEGFVWDSGILLASIPPINFDEYHQFGEGFQGDILFISFSNLNFLWDIGTHTPFREGKSQCPGCVWHFDMDDHPSGIITSEFGTFTMTINGTWLEYPDGY